MGLAEPRPIDALSLAFFSDALIPAPYMRMTESVGRADDRPDGPLPRAPAPAAAMRTRASCAWRRPRSELVHDGFFVEDGRSGRADGTLLAQSRQLAIVIPFSP